MRAQKDAGVERFVYVSAERFRPVAPLLTGYYDGKGAAEAAVDAAFGGAGAILRPLARRPYQWLFDLAEVSE